MFGFGAPWAGWDVSLGPSGASQAVGTELGVGTCRARDDGK